MAGIEFSDVARLLTCREFAEAEGMKIRGGRCVCPFHAGAHNFNLAFVNDGRRVYCHKCGRSGDVVTLAAAVWRMTQRDAAAELNERFKLGLSGETLTQAERDRREQARQRERDLREAEHKAEARAWSAACDAERAAQAAIERFTEADADGAEFDQALKRLCEAQQRCELLQAARAEVRA